MSQKGFKIKLSEDNTVKAINTWNPPLIICYTTGTVGWTQAELIALVRKI